MLNIPLICEEWYPKNTKQHEKENESWVKWEQARVRRVAAGKAAQNGKDKEPPACPKGIPMHFNDAEIFLNLVAALKIILGCSINDANIPCAKELLNMYLLGCLEVSNLCDLWSNTELKDTKIHPKHIKPSNHWVTHIFEQLEDYGPTPTASGLFFSNVSTRFPKVTQQTTTVMAKSRFHSSTHSCMILSFRPWWSFLFSPY